MDVEKNSVIATGSEVEEMTLELAFKMPLTNKPYRSADGPSGNLRKKIAKYLPSLTFHQQGDLHIAPEMGEDLQRIG